MERKLLTIFLCGSLTLGFFSFVSGYLPAKIGTLPQAAQPTPTVTVTPVSLSEILEPAEEPEVATTDSPVLAGGSGGSMPPERRRVGVWAPPLTGPANLDESGTRRHPFSSTSIELKSYAPLPHALALKNSAYHLIEKSLQPMVEFWINVYANYDLHHTILHDANDLAKVYGVLDFEALWKDETRTEKEKRVIRSEIEADKKEELAEKFPEVAENIRGQWGQKSKFESGLIRSGRYMPQIQAIFANEGVPKDVAYLVFVESMFTMGAVSKVGAGGPWQFMPHTARLQGLKMDHYMDERRDPILGGKAAAKLLRKNYELLGTWPLAINAYNSGPLRMQKAVDRLRTKKIDVIIRNFQDRGYQFASRNFYPEFLAAYVVASGHRQYFGEVEMEEPIAFEQIILPWNASLYALAQTTATDVGVLKEMNPAYHGQFFEQGASIPQGSTIRIPAHQKEIFMAALDEAKTMGRMASHHIVKRGETLYRIARRYQVPVQELKSFNRLIGLHISPGQILKIPSGVESVVLEDR